MGGSYLNCNVGLYCIGYYLEFSAFYLWGFAKVVPIFGYLLYLANSQYTTTARHLGGGGVNDAHTA